MPTHRPLAVEKTHIERIIDADESLTRLVYAYAACAACWLVFGSLVGEYIGIRLSFPDFGVHPLLSFGRLRPVHTNVLFWGWSSLGMIALSLFVVPRTSQKGLHSIPLARLSLWLINIAVAAGVVCLLNGVSNGAQEYREFTWPAMGRPPLRLQPRPLVAADCGDHLQRRHVHPGGGRHRQLLPDHAGQPPLPPTRPLP